jgi:flavin reductase (DIM6/NTAB) family NADH-FMN oxidoreductase RutF
MEKLLNRINIKSLPDNLFKLLDNDWMLVTAGNLDSYNTMTASWGSFGILWNKPIANCFIRPSRYTLEFINKSDFFTLSFFEHKYHDALNYCGSHSGKNTDKALHTGLTPVVSEHGSIYFSQARIVLECKKLYVDKLNPDNFVQTSLIKDIYPQHDFHHIFIGEIKNCLSTDVIAKEKPANFENPEIDYLP